MNILIVEDNLHDLELILNELKKSTTEWSYRHCDNKEEYEQILVSDTIDFIICDYNLPSFTCTEALLIARNNNEDIPFFIVSGFIGEDQVVNLIIENGVNDFISKNNLSRLTHSITRESKSLKLRRELKKNRVEQERSLMLLKAINDITTSILNTDSLTDIANAITEKIMTHFDFEDCVIYSFDGQTNLLEQIAATGPKKNPDCSINSAITLKIGDGIVGSVAKSLQPEIVNDLTKDLRYIKDIESNNSEITVPILLDGELIGIIDSEHEEKNYYTQQHLQDLQTVAGVIATKFKAAQENDRLCKVENQIKQITENIEGVVFRHKIIPGSRSKLIYVSSKINEVFEVDINSALSDTNLIWNQIIEEDRAHVNKVFNQSIDESKSLYLIFRIKTPSGKLKWIEATGNSILQSDGSFITDTINIDVTERIKINKQVQDSEELLRSITNNFPGAVIRCSTTTNDQVNIDYISKGCEEIFEASQQEILQEKVNVWQLFSQEDFKEIVTSIKKSADEMTSLNFTYPITTKSGKIKYLQGNGTAQRVHSEEKIIFDTVILDITTQKETEIELLETNQSLKSAHKVGELGNWHFHLTSDNIEWSEQLFDIYDRDRDLGAPDFDEFLSYHDMSSENMQTLIAAIQTGQSYDLDIKLITTTGIIKYIRAIGTPEINSNGDLIGYSGLAQDITNRIALQKKLENSEFTLDTAVKGANLGVWDANIRDQSSIMNYRWFEMLGYEPEEIADPYNFFFSMVHPDHSKLIQEEIKLIESGKKESFELIIKVKSKSGKYRTILDKGTALEFDENGRVIRMIGTHLDITEQEELRIKIENSLKEKTLLLSEIHHRVKNNLAIVTGLLSLQSIGSEDEELKALLGETARRIKSIAQVHELLYNTDSFTDIPFDKYVRTLTNSISETLDNKNGSINLDIDENLVININQAIPLGLLLNELITNSFKYAFDLTSKKNEINFSLNFKEGFFHANYHDSGAGFDSSKLESSSSLGSLLIDTLLQQLEADFQIETEKGYKIDFTFTESISGAHSNF